MPQVMFSIAHICPRCLHVEHLRGGDVLSCPECGEQLAGPVAFPEESPSPSARSGLLTSPHYTATRSAAAEAARR